MSNDGNTSAGERRSRWAPPPSSSRVEDSSQWCGGGGEGELIGRRGYDTLDNDASSSRRIVDSSIASSSSGGDGNNARRSSQTDEQRHLHDGGRNSEGRGYQHHHYQGGNRRWRSDDNNWNHSEERKWSEQRDGDGGEANWRCLECGLSVDKRRCDRCPRCRTWIDTSSSSRRPSGELGDEGGGSGGRGGRSSSSAYDGRDASTAADQRGYDDHDNDGNNYYSRPSDRGPRRSRGGDGSDHYYDRDYDNCDGHGPRKKRRDHTNNDDEEGNEIPKKKKREWPPCFESSGASFIFDARSGMFYEPSSDFFYDPKTKLYYCNSRQQYFRYDVDNDPHSFQPVGGDGGNAATAAQSSAPGIITPRVVTEVEEISADSSPTGQVVSSQTKPEKAEPKQKIAISLKTPLPPKNSSIKSLNDVTALEKIKLGEKKWLRKESASSTTGGEHLAASAGTLPQAHKKHAMDMSKWSERVKEVRQQQPSPPNDIKTTVSGQPMCVLCRRKFANVEKLRQHEKLSMLHKENLTKTTSSASAVVAGPTTNASHVSKEGEESETSSYRDRSKERRLMYGSHVIPQSSHAEALLAHSLGPSSTSTSASEAKHTTQIIRPEETLNDTNVGNKLLQKLGWKSGETLGRNATDGTGTKEDVVNNNLRSDWERIESLAQGGGMRR